MRSAPRPFRAHAVAIPRPEVVIRHEWLAVAVVAGLLLAALLMP